MAQLVRLEALDADASSSSSLGSESGNASVFVHCRRQQKSAHQLQLLLAEGDVLWTATVAATHKPAALACSDADFLRALETAFSRDGATASTSKAFTYKWSRAGGVLTLMEPATAASVFAMKYVSLTLEPVRAGKAALWDELLREVVSEGADAQQQMTRQRRRLAELETLLRDKDALLDTALRAKQQLEDQLFSGFCAVLNAKKDEIRRLQHELAVAQVQARAAAAFDDGGGLQSTKTKKTTKKQPQPRKPTKAKGAKLRRKIKVEYGSDEDEGGGDDSGSENGRDDHDDDDDDVDDSDSHDQSTDDDDDDDTDGYGRSRSRRAKRSAIEAYSQLPSPIRSSSQVCIADDVLSDLDAIMKDEVAANDDEMQSTGGRSWRPRTVMVPPQTSAQAAKKRKCDDASSLDEDAHDRRQAKMSHKSAPVPPPPAPAPVVKPPAPPKAIDSEEEDILDMLA